MIKGILIFALLACCLQAVQAQIVNNIEAEVIGSRIQVSFTLQSATPVDLTMSWSDNDGLSFYPCMTVSGDLTNQASGTKTIIWDCGKDGIIMGSFIFKITYIDAVDYHVAMPVTEPAEIENIREQEDDPVIESLPVVSPRITDTIPNQNIIRSSEAPPNKSHFLIMVGGAAGYPISYSITAGFLSGKWGGYAKFKSNFVSKGDAMTAGPADAFYIEGFSRMGRLSVSAGLNGQITDLLLFYAGIGYGSRWVQWKTLSDKLVTIDTLSFSGIDPELGLALKTGKFLIGAGVSALFGTQTVVEANLSIGLIF